MIASFHQIIQTIQITSKLFLEPVIFDLTDLLSLRVIYP